MNFDPAKLAQNAEPAPNFNAALLQPGIVAEPKMDGFRLLACVGDNGVDTFTRTGKSQKGKLPAIEAELNALPAGTWLDGELVAVDDDGNYTWGQVQSAMGSNVDGAARKSGNLVYMVFDLLAYNGLDIRSLTLQERRNALEQVLPVSARIRLTPQEEPSEDTHDNFMARGFEGTILKRLNAPYASGQRGKGWQKLKPTREMDCVIMGFKPGENGFAGMIGAVEVGQFKDGVLTNRTRVSGMDMKTRVHMTNNQQDYIGMVIEIAYTEMLNDNPRHPRFKRLRIDKPAMECEWC